MGEGGFHSCQKGADGDSMFSLTGGVQAPKRMTRGIGLSYNESKNMKFKESNTS